MFFVLLFSDNMIKLAVGVFAHGFFGFKKWEKKVCPKAISKKRRENSYE